MQEINVLTLLGKILKKLIFNMSKRSLPTVEGEIFLQGLKFQVKIIRDNAGIPHIYAKTEEDLFFAQGYCHAQDRFW